MIRIDKIWLATEPLDMRAGPDTARARVIQVFGSAKLNGHDPYAYLKDVLTRRDCRRRKTTPLMSCYRTIGRRRSLARRDGRPLTPQEIN